MPRKLLIAAIALLAIALITERTLVKPVLAQVRAALIQNIDEPGRTPFALNGSAPNASQFFFTVPASQRYVVEAYTARCDEAAPATMTDITLSGKTNGQFVALSAQPHLLQPNGAISGVAQNLYVGTGSQPLYADPGSTIGLYANDSTSGNSMRGCEFWITGHIINNP